MKRRLLAPASSRPYARFGWKRDRLAGFRLQRALQVLVRADFDGLFPARDFDPVVDAQVEPNQADRRCAPAAGDLPVTVRNIGNDLAGRDQIQVLGMAEREIELRKL